MGSLRWMGKAVNAVLTPVGFEIRRRNMATMEQGLRRLGRHGFGVQSVIDVGAAEGNWTRMMLPVFPRAQFLLIEALQERKEALDRFCQRSLGRFAAEICAAGPDQGTLTFTVTDNLDGSGGAFAEGDRKGERRTVPMMRIDDLVMRHQLPPPYCLKLDTHGFEIPILEGAVHTLEKTQVLVIECYLFRCSTGWPLFWEICQWLDERGFRCFDLVDPLHRPHDKVLWQIDLFFTQSDWPTFHDLRYP